MSFYLSNSDVHPTGLEPGEFLDLMTMAETMATTAVTTNAPREPSADEGPTTSTGPPTELGCISRFSRSRPLVRYR